MKEYALRHGLCGEYTKMWDDAKDVEQLMMMATDANGLPFLAEAFADGWGVSEKVAIRMFGDYINGRWQAQHNGYTSEIWIGVRTGEKIVARSTAMLIDDCAISVDIPARSVRKVLISGDSNVTITCMGVGRVQVYGKNAVANVNGHGRCDVEYIGDYKWR